MRLGWDLGPQRCGTAEGTEAGWPATAEGAACWRKGALYVQVTLLKPAYAVSPHQQRVSRKPQKNKGGDGRCLMLVLLLPSIHCLLSSELALIFPAPSLPPARGLVPQG